MNQRVVHGDDLLYRFFADGFRTDPELFERVSLRLLIAVSVWLPLDAYHAWPLLMPWVVRDPTCRGNKSKGVPDQWSSPNVDGYLRDDNSLIKSVPRSLQIRGPKGTALQGARMGSEFVASHIWRVVNGEQLASRNPMLNSFVPNLVWLPQQVSKLSDREGSPIQETLKAVSYAIYRHAPVAAGLEAIAERSWAMLPLPQLHLPKLALDEMNWFKTSEPWFRMRSDRLDVVLDALRAIDDGLEPPARVVSTRYGQGLPLVSASARSALFAHLSTFKVHGSSPVG